MIPKYDGTPPLSEPMRARIIVVEYTLTINKFVFLQISIFRLARGERGMKLSNGAAEREKTALFMAEAREKKRRSHCCSRVVIVIIVVIDKRNQESASACR